MPRPVRELWTSLGAVPGDADDLLVVDADALTLPSVFGGSLSGSVVVRLFSDEAFGFASPEEMAALGVFWAPHLDDTKQLRAAVVDAQDRLRRKLEEDSGRLEAFGFSPSLEAPRPLARGRAEIGGLALEVALGPNGELLLERVDGGEVPAEQRQVLRELEDVSPEHVQDALTAHGQRLVSEGLVTPATPGQVLEDAAAGFGEIPRTQQLPAGSLEGGDTGTLLVPPPSDDDEAMDDVEARPTEAALSVPDLAAALDEEDLADSEEGPPLDSDELADSVEASALDPAELADSDEDFPVDEASVEGDGALAGADAARDAERLLAAERAESVEPAAELDEANDASDSLDASDASDDDAPGEDAPEPEPADGAEALAPEDDDDFVEQLTAPVLAGSTASPEGFDDEYPAMPTLQMSALAAREGAEEASSDGSPSAAGEELASEFDEETGEERAVVSFSGDDGVMPSPLAATELRAAPTSDELNLYDDDYDSNEQPAADDDEELAKAGDEDDDEDTVARPSAFRSSRSSRTNASLASSASAGSSIEQTAAGHADASSDESVESGESGESEEEVTAAVAYVDAGEASGADDDENAAGFEEPNEEGAELIEDDDQPTALHGFTPRSSLVREEAKDEEAANEAEPTDPALDAVSSEAEDVADSPSSLEVDLEAEGDEDDELEPRAFAAPRSDVSGSAASEIDAPASGASEIDAPRLDVSAPDAPVEPGHWNPLDDEDAEPTQAGLSPNVPGSDPLEALAAIVGEGMSSGKTGAVVLDANAFAYLRSVAEEDPIDATEDPDALEREAELLELKARELRAKAELLRERAAVPVAKRRLASELEKARAARAEEERAAALASESVPSNEAAFASSEGIEDAADDEDAFAPAASVEREAARAPEVDAFADGVALEEVRAMLAAEAAGGDGYAATQLAEMDLAELRQASLSGGDVFEGGLDDDKPAYARDATGAGPAVRTSLVSLPQAESADVQALASVADPASDARLSAGRHAPRVPPLPKPSDSPRALALVVSDPRARERLKKHLEDTFPHVVELASARDAVSLTARDVHAVVIVRPSHDDATVSGLEALEGSRARPPVLVLSSDASFDGMPGVDLRLELGRRASEVARQVLEGLSTLGVRASA